MARQRQAEAAASRATKIRAVDGTTSPSGIVPLINRDGSCTNSTFRTVEHRGWTVCFSGTGRESVRIYGVDEVHAGGQYAWVQYDHGGNRYYGYNMKPWEIQFLANATVSAIALS